MLLFIYQCALFDNDEGLAEARNMVLAPQALFASYTPTIAWNYDFGDMEAFYSERFA